MCQLCEKQMKIERINIVRRCFCAVCVALNLYLIEFFFRLLTARASPVVRQDLKGCAVMLCGIVYITADGADIDFCSFLFGKVVFFKDRFNRMIQIHHAISFKILIALRGMGADIDGRMIADELAYTIERLSRCGKIVIDDR